MRHPTTSFPTKNTIRSNEIDTLSDSREKPNNSKNNVDFENSFEFVSISVKETDKEVEILKKSLNDNTNKNNNDQVTQISHKIISDHPEFEGFSTQTQKNVKPNIMNPLLPNNTNETVATKTSGKKYKGP